jgi:hypothetical protein
MEFNLFKNRRNIILFMVSIIFAFLLWFYAKTNEIVVVERTLPVQIKTPKNIILKGVSPDSVTVKIKAKKRQHNMLNKISPVIKLLYDFPGIYKFRLDENILSFPAFLGIEDYEIQCPDSIQVEIDSLIRTKVGITSVKGMSFEPDKVIIVGPKSMVSNIDYLSPDSIPKGNFTTITIGNPLIEIFPSKIRVRQ